MRMLIAMQKHYNIPGFLFLVAFRSFFGVSQCTSYIIVVACCLNSTISTNFLSFAKGFLAG
jgi:hypothetical protein